MPDIYYAASIRGAQKAERAIPAGFIKQAGLGRCQTGGTSFRDDSVPVPVAAMPVFRPQRLWHGETGWEPCGYSGGRPPPPKTVSINMEFTIPADRAEAHINYSN